jgi:hypothetical protein
MSATLSRIVSTAATTAMNVLCAAAPNSSQRFDPAVKRKLTVAARLRMSDLLVGVFCLNSLAATCMPNGLVIPSRGEYSYNGGECSAPQFQTVL